MVQKTIVGEESKEFLPFEFKYQDQLFDAYATENDNGTYFLHLEELVFYVKNPILVFKNQDGEWGAEQSPSKDPGFIKAGFDAFHKKYLS